MPIGFLFILNPRLIWNSMCIFYRFPNRCSPHIPLRSLFVPRFGPCPVTSSSQSDFHEKKTVSGGTIKSVDLLSLLQYLAFRSVQSAQAFNARHYSAQNIW